MKKILFFLFVSGSLLFPRAGLPRAFAASAEDKMALVVTDNNPFNPSRGQVITFRYCAKDADRTLRVRIFTPSGTLVREFPEQDAVKNTSYERVWDGKNEDGETVSRGIYIVSLQETGSFTRGMARKIAVLK